VGERIKVLRSIVGHFKRKRGGVITTLIRGIGGDCLMYSQKGPPSLCCRMGPGEPRQNTPRFKNGQHGKKRGK